MFLLYLSHDLKVVAMIGFNGKTGRRVGPYMVLKGELYRLKSKFSAKGDSARIETIFPGQYATKCSPPRRTYSTSPDRFGVIVLTL